jgi:hypothetical protein
MHLDLVGHVGCPTGFAYLGKESFFPFRSTVPGELVRSVPDGCLVVPDQGNASPGRRERLLSLSLNRHVESVVGFSLDRESGMVFLVHCPDRYLVFGRKRFGK